MLPAGPQSAGPHGCLPAQLALLVAIYDAKAVMMDRTVIPACRLQNGSGAMDPHQSQLAAQQQQMAALLQQQFMQLGLPPPTPQQQLEFWQTTQAQQHQAQVDQHQHPQQAAPSSIGESPTRWIWCSALGCLPGPMPEPGGDTLWEACGAAGTE